MEVKENQYSIFYDTVYDYGELAVTTAGSPLSAPTNLQIVSAASSRVELKWDPVSGMGENDVYEVWCDYLNNENYIDWGVSKEPAFIDEADPNDETEYQYDVGNKFLVVVRQGVIRSGDSNAVTITTLSPAPVNTLFSLVPIARAVGAPQNISAKAAEKQSKAIEVTWDAVVGVKEYTVGLFKSQTGSAAKTKTAKDGITQITLEDVDPGVYYVGVKPKGATSYTKTPYTVSPFPKDIDIKSASITKGKMTGWNMENGGGLWLYGGCCRQ